MRKLTNVLIITVALTVQFMAGQALAALVASGPVNSSAPGAPFPANNLPSYYQDSNGLSLQGCLDNSGGLVGNCVLPLIVEEDYTTTDVNGFLKPIVYCGGLAQNLPAGPLPGPTLGINGCTVNYPSETFYYFAGSDPKATIDFGAAGGSIRLILMAVEGAYVTKDGRFLQQAPFASAAAVGNSRPVDGIQGVFQRFKILMDAPVSGNYTFTHPWGTEVFNCPVGPCKLIHDIPLGAPLNFLVNPDPALGQGTLGSIGPFMVKANATLPGIPATAAPFSTNLAGNQFIGNPRTNSKGIVPGVCPTCPKNADGFSFMRIDGPPLVAGGAPITTGDITTFVIGGQTIGLQVSPGNSIDLGRVTIQTPPVASAVQTVTITNLTGNTILFPALVTAGTNPAEFTFAAPAPATACSGATILNNGTCTIDVAFTPAVGTTAARSATIAVAPTTVQPPVTVPPTPVIPNPGAITINLSGTAQYPLTVAVATTDTLSATITANSGNGTLTSSSPGQSSLICSNVAAVVGALPTATPPAVPCTASFDVGSTVTLKPTATQSPLSLFDGFTGLCTGIGACTVVMDAAKGTTAAPAVTADFVESHVINTSAIPAAGGAITPTLTVKHGSTPTVIITPTNTASPRVAYRLGTVTDTAGVVALVPVGTGSFNYQLAPVDGDHTVVANFVQQFNLTPTTPLAAEGTISPALQTVDSGATAQDYTITPAAGYRITTLVKDGVTSIVAPTAVQTQTVSFNPVTADHSISATFIKIWNVTSSVAGSGSVDNLGTLIFDDGKPASYTFTPLSNKFQVGKILVDGAPQLFTKPATISGAVTLSLPAVTANKTVSTTFVPSGDLDGNGTVDIADALKALKIFVSLQTADSTDLAAMKIGGLETVTVGTKSSLVPLAGTGAPDLNDIILILKKAVKAITW